MLHVCISCSCNIELLNRSCVLENVYIKYVYIILMTTTLLKGLATGVNANTKLLTEIETLKTELTQARRSYDTINSKWRSIVST